MEQCPSSEANRFAASQEISSISWNPNVHYHIRNSPLTVPILSQIDQVHAVLPHFLKIHLNIILPSIPGSPKWTLSFGFHHRNHLNASPFPNTRHTHTHTHTRACIYIHIYINVYNYINILLDTCRKPGVLKMMEALQYIEMVLRHWLESEPITLRSETLHLDHAGSLYAFYYSTHQQILF